MLHAFTTLLAPIALWLSGPQDGVDTARLTAEQALEAPGVGSQVVWFEAAPYDIPFANQVRIEQRVILRVSPRPGNAQSNFAASQALAQNRSRLVQRPYGDCVPVANIAAVQAQRGSRLLLFLRDRRLLAADLEKTCSAQNFYSGFYLEANEDGRLCIGRDRLQSRNGAKCSVSSMHQIVAVAGD